MQAQADVSVRRLSFSKLDNFPSLFQDYCARFEAVAAYFAGDHHALADRRAAVERTISRPRDRETLVTVLLEQNERWGLNEETRRNIELLRQPDTAVVITGQQVGLFTGPMYTILKTITTLQLAEQLSLETSTPVVPVFWLGAEDHDFDEVAGIRLVTRNQPIDVLYTHAWKGINAGPVGRLVLGAEIEAVVNEIEDSLPPSEFKAEVIDAVRRAYVPGRTFADAFALLLRRFFSNTGLILISSDDERLKRVAMPLFRKELEEGVAPRLRDVSSRLRERYHEQVQVRPVNLFLLEEDGRIPIEATESGFSTRDGSGSTGKADMLRLVEQSPERFSPNVVLRPLMQDWLFPTAIYVGGPAEISYFAQYKPAYEWAGLPMPLIYPRASVTIVESKVTRVLEKYGLHIGDLGDELDRLFHRVVVSQMDMDVEEAFAEASRHLDEAIDHVKSNLSSIDPTLLKSAEASRASLQSELGNLKTKTVRAEKRNRDAIRDQLEKAQVNLFPGGVLQERSISILQFLNKYSPAFLDELRSALSTDTSEHQIVEL